MTHVVPGNPIGKKVAAARIDFHIGGVFLNLVVGLLRINHLCFLSKQLVDELLLFVMRE